MKYFTLNKFGLFALMFILASLPVCAQQLSPSAHNDVVIIKKTTAEDGAVIVKKNVFPDEGFAHCRPVPQNFGLRPQRCNISNTRCRRRFSFWKVCFFRDLPFLVGFTAEGFKYTD